MAGMILLRLSACACLVLGLLSLAGCQGAEIEKVNDELRAKNLKQEQELGQLRGQLADRDATIKQLQGQLDARVPRVQTLKPERLAQLFTAARVQIRPQTEAWDWQGDKRPDGFRVFVRVLAAGDEIIPATGTLTIEAFDLALEEGSQRLGTWTFTPEQMKAAWYSAFGSNHFAVNCPWAKPPGHADITFKVKFVDALTGNVLVDQMHKNVKLGDSGQGARAGK
jgi:hypothetical protein